MKDKIATDTVAVTSIAGVSVAELNGWLSMADQFLATTALAAGAVVVLLRAAVGYYDLKAKRRADKEAEDG